MTLEPVMANTLTIKRWTSLGGSHVMFEAGAVWGEPFMRLRKWIQNDLCMISR